MDDGTLENQHLNAHTVIHLTMRKHILYRIQHRRNEGQTVLCGCRLFQQFIIDAYTTIEEKILRFICKYPQKKVYM